MAKRVDHEQRKQEIAEKAIHLFSQVGYDNVSLLMIAAACGISRTVMYRYFCSKLEVLDASIVYLTDTVEKRCHKILKSRQSNTAKLEGICQTVVEVMFKNKQFLIAVFDYAVGMVRTGVDMNNRIWHFTKGTRLALKMVIEHAIKKGEIIDTLDVERISDTIYSQFESCAMRIALGTEGDSRAAKIRFSDIVHAISNWR